ncbi:MAG: heavy metal translocating P-type ATPase metal-binding domain-containing protein [Verrucomicrobiota bacterium JB022]|nr:heavy metal translocating P-type ATPase metal-binding domain-containing protein [Verrucomicrobiota bacterium JB022]
MPSATTKVCAHCGTPFEARASQESEYCCNGCAYVARMIASSGFDQYYDLRDRIISPVKPAALQKRDYRWLAQLQADAEAQQAKPSATTDLDLTGISCVGCVWLIERVVSQQEGIQRVEVNAQLGQVRIQWQSERLDRLALGDTDDSPTTVLTRAAEALQQFGYLLQPPGKRETGESQRLLGRVGITGAAAMNAMLFTLPRYLGMPDDFELAGLFGLFTLLSATIALLAGGTYFIDRAVRALRIGALHIDFPIALGITLAYAGSLFGYFYGHETYAYFDFVAIFTFLMLGGRWLQERAVERNRFALRQSRLQPTTARVVGSTGGVSDQAIETLKPGQVVRCGPGDLVPVRSRLSDQSPAAELSLEWINGEAEPVRFQPGQVVPAGAINVSRQPFDLTAEETWEESLLRRLTTIEPRQLRHVQLEAILRYYLVAVLIIGVIGSLTWGLSTGNWLVAGQVALSVLVVSCPCALGVAYPLAQEQSVAQLRRAGVYVKEADLFHRLRHLKRIVFDKTGTLTLETPDLAHPEVLHALGEAERAALWRLVEDGLHPISRALRESLLALGQSPVRKKAALHGNPDNASVSPVQEAVGFGVTVLIDGHRYALGRPMWAAAASQGELDRIAGNDINGNFDCALARDGELLAQLKFVETVREDAVPAVASLQKRGLQLHILSGDREEKVSAMARHLGLPAEAALGRLTPEQKAEWVQQHDPALTLFIGDGANDSLAFDAAAVRGTPVVDRGLLEAKADFYFLGRNLGGLLTLLDIEHRRRRAVQAVFAFAVCYNLVAIALCLAALMNPLLAAILMPLSSLVTIGIVSWRMRG